MVERLSTLDASFLYLEEPDTPMHVGGVLILEAPPGGVEALADLVEARLSLVPRYRQRVAEVPGHLANPVWVDDPDFDIDYHVRRSGLPRPGTEAQLLDLVSRLTSRPLRPPASAVGDLPGRGPLGRTGRRRDQDAPGAGRRAQRHRHRPGTARCRTGRARRPSRGSGGRERPPSGAELVLQALDEYVRRPSSIVDTARGAVTDVRADGGAGERCRPGRCSGRRARRSCLRRTAR